MFVLLLEYLNIARRSMDDRKYTNMFSILKIETDKLKTILPRPTNINKVTHIILECRMRHQPHNTKFNKIRR